MPASTGRSTSSRDKARERTRKLNEGIALLLSGFVHRLHDAGGKGRYPDKGRQAMQMEATAVSQASLIAKVPVKDVADALGPWGSTRPPRRPRLQSARSARPLQRDDDWEQLFDDRGTRRVATPCRKSGSILRWGTTSGLIALRTARGGLEGGAGGVND